jgi:hypothetical protein
MDRSLSQPLQLGLRLAGRVSVQQRYVALSDTQGGECVSFWEKSFDQLFAEACKRNFSNYRLSKHVTKFTLEVCRLSFVSSRLRRNLS